MQQSLVQRVGPPPFAGFPSSMRLPPVRTAGGGRRVPRCGESSKVACHDCPSSSSHSTHTSGRDCFPDLPGGMTGIVVGRRRTACCVGVADPITVSALADVQVRPRRTALDVGRPARDGLVLVVFVLTVLARRRAVGFAMAPRALDRRRRCRSTPIARDTALAVPLLALLSPPSASSTRAGAPRARRRRADRRPAGGAARLHDRADQRHPRRADDRPRYVERDRRARSTRSTPTWSRSPATSSTARCRELGVARRAARAACARGTAPSSSPATTSTTRARAAWVAELRRLGIACCSTSTSCSSTSGAALVLAGVTDFSAAPLRRVAAQRSRRGARRRAGRRAVPACCSRTSRARAAAARRAGFDLQLSGHTHGGQFLPWNFFVRLQQPFTAGLHRSARLWVYTSRGTGYWGPPKRFGAPSEITRCGSSRR